MKPVMALMFLVSVSTAFAAEECKNYGEIKQVEVENGRIVAHTTDFGVPIVFDTKANSCQQNMKIVQRLAQAQYNPTQYSVCWRLHGLKPVGFELRPLKSVLKKVRNLGH